MAHRRSLIVLASIVPSLAGCYDNPLYCASDADCIEPGRPVCDREGLYQDVRNTCVPSPATDAATCDPLLVGRACDGDDGDICPEGIYICGTDLTVICDDFTTTQVEVCDSVDNDCDSRIDEETQAGAPCDGEDADVCLDGRLVCDLNEQASCIDPEGEGEERCDGVDNDCDEAIDEGVGGMQSCDGDDADACAEGQTRCDAAGSLQCLEPDGRHLEVCNGVDDDCDGPVDEETQAGQPCDGSDGDACTEGVLSCDGDTLLCSDTTSSDAEVCDGIDNDCIAGVPFDENDTDSDGWRICGGDCNDSNALTFPGQPQWFHAAVDYNCDGAITKHWTTLGYCPPTLNCGNLIVGWQGTSPPACGQSGYWITGCVDVGGKDCDTIREARVQECQ